MSKELQVKGTQKLNGKDVTIIEGGFGEGQKCILANDIAGQHGLELRVINQMIDRNITRYTKDDLLDLCDENFKITACDLGLITSNRQKHCYILSERGYIKLVSSMANDNDKKWEVMDEVINNYFKMREIVNSIEQQKAQLLLSIYNGGQEGVLASKQLTEIEVEEATKPLKDKIEEDKPLVDFANTITESSDCIDIGKLAKVIKDEGINMGRNKLFEWLRNNGYLMKDNVPYQRYIEQGIFQIKEYTFETPYGTKLSTKTLVTGKGQVYIVEKLRNITK